MIDYMKNLINLYYCIKHLGFDLGISYWKTCRFYTKHPEFMPELIESTRKIDPGWADIMATHYQNWLAKNNI